MQTYEEYLQRHGQGHLRDCNGYPQVRLPGSVWDISCLIHLNMSAALISYSRGST